MANTKTISVPVTNGMREDVSPHVAPPGTITNAENVRFPTPGEVESRPGSTALSAATSADVAYTDLVTTQGPDFLQRVPGGFVVGSQGFGFRYDFGKSRLHVAGGYADAMPVRRFAVMAVEEASYTLGDSTPWPLSVAIGGGYVAILWSGGQGVQDVDSGYGIRCQIFTEGGALVTTISRTDYLTGWVLYDNFAGAFILIGQQPASGNPELVDAAIITLDASGATLGSFVNVADLFNTASSWAVSAWPGIGWALIYQSADTTATIKQMTGTTQLLTDTFSMPGDNTMQPVSVYCDATHAYFGWVDVGVSNVAKARAYSVLLADTSGGAVTVYTDTSVAFLSLTPPLFGTSAVASSAFLVVGRATDLGSASGATTFMVARNLTALGSLTSVNQVAYNLFPVTGAFNNGMVWCRYQPPASSDDYGNGFVRYVLVDYVNNRVSTADSYWKMRWPKLALAGDAFADPQPGDYRTAWRLHMCHPQQLSNSNWLVGLPRLVRSEQPGGTTARGLVLGEWLEYTVSAPRTSQLYGGEVIVPGSLALLGLGGFGTRNYATAALAEPATANQANGVDLGFWGQPSIVAPSQSNGAGALTALGVYQYRCVVEWIDGVGRRWRSRPSRALPVTMTGANDTNTFTEVDDFAWVRQGYQQVSAMSNVVKHYYRTVSGGSTFYRVSPPQGAPIAAAGATFIDIMSDGIALSREILYTDGGVLDNDHPSSCRYIATMEDRIWIGGLWDLAQIQSSKVLVPGEPPQFTDSPAFKVVLPDECTGLAAQDGVLIAFCKSAIYAVQGAGPNDQGQGAWESPRVITRSTGCTNARSILETSAGVFFQSSRGIELLPRGSGEPVFIGAPVEGTFVNSNVTSAAVISSGISRTARFCIGTTAVLVYDLNTNSWSRDVYPAAVTHICDTDNGAVLALKTPSAGFGFLRENGTVANDSTGNSPVAVASTLEWAALRPFGIAGQGRFTAAIGLFTRLIAGSSPGYQAGNATLFVTVDRASDPGAAFDMAAFNSPDYRKHAPLVAEGTACVLKLTAAVNGWRFMGWTVELDAQEGGRRMAETEQG